MRARRHTQVVVGDRHSFIRCRLDRMVRSGSKLRTDHATGPARKLARRPSTYRIFPAYGPLRRKSSKPVRSCSPRLGRFDSCAAPLAGLRRVSAERGAYRSRTCVERQSSSVVLRARRKAPRPTGRAVLTVLLGVKYDKSSSCFGGSPAPSGSATGSSSALADVALLLAPSERPQVAETLNHGRDFPLRLEPAEYPI
jgi:hypothetical protein